MKKTALVFPGQGAQTVGMGKQLFESSKAARDVFESADSALDIELSKLIFDGPIEELTRSNNAQPAILTVSIACLRALEEYLGEIMDRVSILAGHSLGEYSALVASNSLSLDNALSLVRRRGELMQIASEKTPGVMVALIGIDFESAKDLCSQTGAEIANVNSPMQVVLGGSKSAIEQATLIAKDYGVRRAIQLEVAGAFHTSMMASAQIELAKELEKIEISEAEIPVVSNSSAELIKHPESIREELKIQTCSTVLWNQSVLLMAENGIEQLVELGPSNTLSGLTKRISPEIEAISIQDLDTIKLFARSDFMNVEN
ncbi:MAG: [acyl-carrier-protein] S-malonyltransferase [Dehalococcoidia bacterium]|nr:[acyl-carrier-protein] S-malonyltransferase [Dehalococcoidia bacterium]|tara:strand:+ start:21010 stop:21957 length:948 start_codon:yes stop_codon:yes gene_type:complete